MSYLRSFKLLVLPLAFCLLFSGCMNTTHLKDMVIVEGLAIDKTEEEISITIQTLNIGLTNGSQTPDGNMTTNTKRQGKTIQNAITNMSKAMSKRIFFGQNKLIIIGKEVAENQFSKQLDFLLRSSDSRADIAICMTDKKAEDIIKSKENDTAIPCENMLYLIDNNEDAGLSQMIIVNDLLNLYKDKTSDIYLPVLTRKDEKSSVSTAGIALFSGDKLVHITDESETQGFVLMNGKTVDVLISFKDKKLGQVGVRLSDVKCRKAARLIDGRVVFTAKLDADMLINEVENGIEVVLDENGHNKIRLLAENKVKELMEKAFNACLENNSDALRVGEQLACDDADAYKMLSDEWDKSFSSVRFEPDVSLSVLKISDNTQIE